MQVQTAYEYAAVVQRVVDGDTLSVTVDLGWQVFLHDQKVRLYGINCPEKNTEAGRQAMVHTMNWLNVNAPDGRVVLRTRKSFDPDKYGRWLATVTGSLREGSLNDWLLHNGYAVEMTY